MENSFIGIATKPNQLRNSHEKTVNAKLSFTKLIAYEYLNFEYYAILG